MCGITGFVGVNDTELLRRMCNSLVHRGPDEDGFFIDSGIGLAMRRLSIIDLKTGHQPITNEDGSIHVVFNGEIYNYQELTNQLKNQGHIFATSSDTETIVHLYETYELDFVKYLRGMFAIALWDAKRKRLVLARDRIGEKPLFYQEDNGEFYFGSEIKAIIQRPARRNIRPQAICNFLAMGYVPAPETFYDDIQKLPPGCILVHENGRTKVARYWVRGQNYDRNISYNQAKQELSGRLSESIRLCLKSDVEVGGFLSGGIDSSVIVALMRKHSAIVQTFSVGFGGAATGYNELSYAKRMADIAGSKHHELILEAHSSVELLPRILWHYDEPHGEPTSVLVYLLCEFTKRYVKVALGGTGGDEIFYGYPRFAGIRVLEFYKMLPEFIRRHLVERIVQNWPETTRGGRFVNRARRFIQSANMASDEAYLSWVSLINRDIRAELISDTIKANAADSQGEYVLRKYLCNSENRELLDRVADLDVEGYLPEYQLCYMDRMSMANGLEVRSPLCDYDLVDFVTTLPPSYRLKNLRTKHIFKDVASQWIPVEIINRRKRGFDSPIGEWFKGQLREFTEGFLSYEHVKRSGLLNPEHVTRMLGEHLSGRRNYSLQLWSLVALEAWYRMYIEDRVTDISSYSLKDIRGAAASGDKVFIEKKIPGKSSDRRQPSLGKIGSRRITRKNLWDSTPVSLKRLLQPGLKIFSPSSLLGSDFRRHKAFVEVSQYWDAHHLNTYQLEQLQKLCSLAQEKSKFYQDSFARLGFDPGNIRSSNDIRQLPLIDRRIIREQVETIYTTDINSSACEIVTTGGTSGEPVQFILPVGRSAVEYAYLTTSWQRAGYKLGMPMAVLRGRIVRPDRNGLYHEYDPILRHHYYSSFHLSDENIARYLEHIDTIGSCFLHVYPSSVTCLARFIIRNKAQAPANIKGIIAESEIVYPQQRQMVEEVFGCRLFSCYGQSEKVVLAAGCEKSDDYHIWPTYGYFELIDEKGNSVTTPGQRGEIVGTGFINTIMPFIRYRTGDWATYVSSSCSACGREHTIIRDIRGHRTQEVLIAADGSEISWTALNMHDDTFTHVRQFQFFQETPGRAVLRVVPTGEFSQDDTERIHRNLGRKLEGCLSFTTELVKEIPLSARGKAIYVDQRISRSEPAKLD
jgi:asparagine synthase (glutamine-hydrolysing)